jgi:predicted amidohydrolase YtcJ
MNADLLIRAGAIYSMDGHRGVYRAVAVKGERIVGVTNDPTGLDHLISAPGTRVVDDAALTLLPAFFDNHHHVGEASQNSLLVDVSDVRSIDEFVDRLQRRASVTPEGQWIRSSNDWNQDQFVERRLPNALDLDRATTRHPVLCRRGGHMAIVNSMAMRVSNIDRQTPDPTGGKLGHTPDGEPDGILEGGAQYVLLHVPAPALEEQIGALRKWCERLASVGLGGARDALVDADLLRLYRAALERESLPVRIRLMPLVFPRGSVADRIASIDALQEWRDLNTPQLGTWGLKFVLDGGPENGALSQPYASDPTYTGKLNWDPAEIEQVMSAAVERGWRIGTHAIGDVTVRTLLDVYERILAKFPDTRAGALVIEHAFLADAEQRARAIRLGVWVTVQHALLYRLGATLRKLWGEARTREVMPVRAWLDEGAQLSAGSDYPIGSYNPLDTVWGMVTRQTEQVGVQGADYAIDRETAVWLAGAGTAQLLGESASLGSIQAGRFADMVAFRADPLRCPLDDLRSLRPAWTLVGGRVANGDFPGS